MSQEQPQKYNNHHNQAVSHGTARHLVGALPCIRKYLYHVAPATCSASRANGRSFTPLRRVMNSMNPGKIREELRSPASILASRPGARRYGVWKPRSRASVLDIPIAQALHKSLIHTLGSNAKRSDYHPLTSPIPVGYTAASGRRIMYASCRQQVPPRCEDRTKRPSRSKNLNSPAVVEAFGAGLEAI
jgi:hypothetical protein